MKNTNKIIFIVTLVLAIVAIILLNVKITEVSASANQLYNKGQQMIERARPDGVSPYDIAAFGTGAGYVSKATAGLSMAILTMLNVIMMTGTVIYLVLYLISWLIINKKETKGKLITGIVLNIFAILTQIGLAFMLFDIVLPARIVEIVSIAAVIIIYLINIKNIKKSFAEVKTVEEVKEVK